MAAPMKNMPIENESKMCKIEATAVTGFEEIAADDVSEKLGVKCVAERGRIFFPVAVRDVRKVCQLHSVENLFVVMNTFNDLKFTQNKEEDLQLLADTIPQLDWETGLEVWRQFIHFKYKVSPTPIPLSDLENLPPEEEPKLSADSESDSEDEDDEDLDTMPKPKKSRPSNSKEIETSQENEPTDRPSEGVIEIDQTQEGEVKTKNIYLPSFRVTCQRIGKNHSFGSMDAASHFGGILNDYFNWNVDLSNFDIEVFLKLEDNRLRVCLGLTRRSLFRRHISQFGPTSLKSTIGYCMLRLCNIQDGEVVCDPMCGGGTIPIEAAVSWPNAQHICGDIHDLAWPRTFGNITSLNKARKKKGRHPINIDIFQWDTTRLPLRDNSIDVTAIDLPFGKKSGSKFDNRKLYPLVLRELARVVKVKTGRACLLTYDKKNMIKTLNTMQHLWRRAKTIIINMGGLATGVFLLNRTAHATNSIGKQRQKAEVRESSDSKE